MKRIIVADSSLELNEELSQRLGVHFVPFRVDVGEELFIDDGTVDQQHLLNAMKAYPDAPKSAAPAPGPIWKPMGMQTRCLLSPCPKS